MRRRETWADHSEWCDAPFGPYLPAGLNDGETLSFNCRRQEGHDGPHDCQAARDANYVDDSHTLTDPTMIEKFLGEK